MKARLDSAYANTPLARHVFIIGFMGAGKSSVAKRLAEMTGAHALDTDVCIAQRYDKSVSRIIEEDGEAAFRAMETEVIEEVCQGVPAFVACGGGLPCSDVNRHLMKQTGYTVYLRVDVSMAEKRIKDTATRPLFKDVQNASALLDSRIPVYESAADAVVDTAGKDIDGVACDICALLAEEGILC